jgi:hypothetical protein
MSQIRKRDLTVSPNDKVAIPNGRAITVMISPGPDPSKPRKKSMVEAFVDGVLLGSTSVIDDDSNESLAPQTLTVFVPRSADEAYLKFTGQKPGKVTVTEIPLDA